MFNVRFKPVSNQADWSSQIQLTDKATGELIDLTGGADPITWSLTARLISRRGNQYPMIAIDNAALGGITLGGPGVLQVYVPVSTMQGLPVGSYRVYLIAKNSTFTRQIYLGLLPVIGEEVFVAPSYGFGYRYG